MTAARFNGKVAIVTGGSSGIGRGIAERLATEGCSVLIADIAESGESIARDLEASGFDAAYLRTDVTSAEDCARMVRFALTRWERMDILINSAGIGRGGAIADFPEEEWNQVLDVNLKGVFLACRAVLPHFSPGSGVIINLASLAAVSAQPNMAAYAASKAAVVQFTRVLALEGAPKGIRANALCPVWIDTPMLQSYINRHPKPERVVRGMEAGIPLGRLGRVEDVAAAALFLASDEAAFITGVALPIDGGAQCR